MNKMAHCHHQLATVVSLLLQFVALQALRVVASSSVAVYRFPALDHGGLVVTTTSSILSPATFLFDAQLFPEFNRTEGFVLLSRPLQLWADDKQMMSSQQTRREASFNTSFTTATPVSFVVLLDSFPPLASPAAASHGTDNTSAAGVINASDCVANVQVGAVGSYGPGTPDVGLNVTVTPNGTSTTVSIQYDSVTHRMSVHVAAAAGEPRPLNKALLDAPLDLASRQTTQSAFVGFFAPTLRDVVHGVRNWELTADRFPGTMDGDGENNGGVKVSLRLLVVLAVLGSVAAVIGVASVVVCCTLSRRRRQEEFRMEDIMKQVYPKPTSGLGFVGT
jgi:hypothetical protein